MIRVVIGQPDEVSVIVVDFGGRQVVENRQLLAPLAHSQRLFGSVSSVSSVPFFQPSLPCASVPA